MPAELAVVSPLDSTPSVRADERIVALAAHLSTFVAPVLGPLAVYLVSRAQKPGSFGRQHATAALNFHLTLLIASLSLVAFSLGTVAAGAAFAVAFGDWSGVIATIALPVVIAGLAICYAIAGVVFSILATIAAARGEPYTYPVSFHLLR